MHFPTENQSNYNIKRVKGSNYEIILEDGYQRFIDTIKSNIAPSVDLNTVILQKFTRKYEIFSLITEKIKKSDLINISLTAAILINRLYKEQALEIADELCKLLYSKNIKNPKFIAQLALKLEKNSIFIFKILIKHNHCLEHFFEVSNIQEIKEAILICQIKHIQNIFKGLCTNKIGNYELFFELIKENEISQVLALKLLNFELENNFDLQNNEIYKEKCYLENISNAIISDSTIQESSSSADFKSNRIISLLKPFLKTKNDLILLETILILEKTGVDKEINDQLMELLIQRCKMDSIAKKILRIINLSLLNDYDIDNLYKMFDLDGFYFLDIIKQLGVRKELAGGLIDLLVQTYDEKRTLIYNLIIQIIKPIHMPFLLKALESGENGKSKLLILDLIGQITTTIDNSIFLTFCVVFGNETNESVLINTLELLKSKIKRWNLDSKWKENTKLKRVVLFVYPQVKIDNWYKRFYMEYENEADKNVVNEFYKLEKRFKSIN